MAPLQPVKKDGSVSERRVETVLTLARNTIKSLRDREDLSTDFGQELSNHVRSTFPVAINAATVSRVSEFDSVGCDLWNAATNLLREDDKIEQDPCSKEGGHRKLVSTMRAFAFLLIDAAHPAAARRSKDPDQQTRNFKIGLKACRFCLDNDELELAYKILERLAQHVRTVEDDSPLVHIAVSNGSESDYKAELQRLTSQYHLLRMSHASRLDRLDLAEHFFDKFKTSSQSHVSSVAETCAQSCFETGKWLVAKGSAESAVKWLDRALASLNESDIEQLSLDAGDLRLAISSSLVDVLLKTRDENCLFKARTVIEQLETDHGLGNRMAVQLLHLKILLQRRPIEPDLIHGVLFRLLRATVLTDSTFKIIMQAIHAIHKVNDEVAFGALEQLLEHRLIPDVPDHDEESTSAQDRVERACVAYTLYATSTKDPSQEMLIKRLGDVLTTIFQRTSMTSSAKATHAMQTLIWKAAGAAAQDMAEEWCKLLRHAMFERAGQVNKGRIGRKAMSLAIDKGDFNAARAAFFQMPSPAQNESITRYLTFKLAVRSNDQDLAIESLQEILKHADRDATFLYACALEAQQTQIKHIAIAALQAIVDKLPPGIHLPSLLRCTVRLLMSELDEPSREVEEIAHETVRVFETASANLPALKQGNKDQWRAEIEWWSKNSYNLSLKLCGQIHPDALARLLQTCVIFIQARPRDRGPMHEDGFVRRLSLCHFLSASAFIVLGRSLEEGSEESLQHYQRARAAIVAFQTLRREDNDQDHDRRSFELQKLDLECILSLQQWDQLGNAFQSCLDFPAVDSWDALADIVLIVHQRSGTAGLSPPASARMMVLLDRIINDTWQKQKDILKASRWLRLAFSVDLDDGNGQFALKLLGQAAGMARKQSDRQKELFPEMELQWLATTAFNKAVDLFSAGKEGECLEWINGAMELAKWAGDNGALHANLTFKKGQVEERMRDGEL